MGAIDGVEIAPPPAPVIESFFSNLLDASPAGSPPRQGKQHRNSVEQEIIAQVHDYSMTSLKGKMFNDLWLPQIVWVLL